MICNFNNRFFAHTVAEKIGSRIRQYRASYFIVPIIIMSEPPQACLNASDDDRSAGESFSHKMRVNKSRPFGPKVGTPPWGVSIVIAGPFICRADFSLAGLEGVLDSFASLQTDLVQLLGVTPSEEPIEIYLFHDKATYAAYLKRYPKEHKRKQENQRGTVQYRT